MTRRSAAIVLVWMNLSAATAWADDPPSPTEPGAPAPDDAEIAQPPYGEDAPPSPEPSPDPVTLPNATPDATPDTSPAPAPDASQAPAGPPIPLEPTSKFEFGSYGRINLGADGRGGTPEPVAVVAHWPRVVENTYLELELRHTLHTRDDWWLRTVITPAFIGEPFHYSGDTDTTLVLRNLYAEFSRGALSLWVGSRMVRGDDVYLLDYWPLDNLNLVGGGARWAEGRLELKLHAGANRLLDPYQYQLVDVADPLFGATTIEQLDRQRGVIAAKGTWRVIGPETGEGFALKASLYLEAQAIGEGERERTGDTTEALPSDQGVVLGAQLGAWGFARGTSHANLFVRYAKGLAASDWLAVPAAVGLDLRTWENASEVVIGTSSNLELARAGVMVGAYARRFTSASPDADTDPASGWEAVLDARPYVQLGGPLSAAVDLSWQKRWPSGLSPSTLGPVEPSIFQIAPMLLVTPLGTGSYARPQLRVVYRAAHLDEDARDQYPFGDPRRDQAWVHYLGVQAEWWFNSSYQ